MHRFWTENKSTCLSKVVPIEVHLIIKLMFEMSAFVCICYSASCRFV